MWIAMRRPRSYFSIRLMEPSPVITRWVRMCSIPVNFLKTLRVDFQIIRYFPLY